MYLQLVYYNRFDKNGKCGEEHTAVAEARDLRRQQKEVADPVKVNEMKCHRM